MEFAFRSRQTMAAADDVGTGRLRRFPDDLPPPPPHGGDNASPVDAAALARRREELLLELDRARFRQDAIFRELVLTEHAMGIAPAGYNPVPTLPWLEDYWRHRPSPSPVPPLEELPLHPPRSSTERSPSGPAPVREPPVYPYVEWSPPPSPLPQPQPASDTEKQQDEACLPAVANAGALPTLCEEVTPEHKDAGGGERKADVVGGHGVNLMSKSVNQNSEQRTSAETTPVDQIEGLMLQLGKYKQPCSESTTFDQQKGPAFSEPKPEQPQLGNGDEQKAGVLAFNSDMELCLSPSRRTPVEETFVPVANKAGSSPMQSVPSFGKEIATGQQEAFGEPKDGHGMQPLGDVRNQISGQRKAMESSMEGWTDKPAQPPGQRRPAGQENAAYNEQNKVEFSEPKPLQSQPGNGDEQKARVEETLVPVAAKAGISSMQSVLSFGKETTAGQQQTFGEPKANVEDAQPLEDIRNKSSGQRMAMESSMEGRTEKPVQVQPPGEHKPAGQESAAHNEQDVEFSELKPEQPQLGNGDEQKSRVHVFNGELCLSPSKRAQVEETLVPAAAKAGISPMQPALSFGKEMATGHQLTIGRETKAIVEDGHGMQPLSDIRNQSSGHRKAMESAMEGRTFKPARSPGRHRPEGQENAAYNEQSKVEFSESTPERTSYGLKRKLEDSGPLIKKQKPHWPLICTTCNVTTTSQHDLQEHLAGRRHRLMVEELQSSRSDTAAAPSTKVKPVWDRIANRNGHFYCNLCDAKCNSERVLESHLGGRRHRERLEESG